MNIFVEYEKFVLDARKKFASFTHPQLAVNDIELVTLLSTWYERIFAEKLKYQNCGVCLYEIFYEMANMKTENVFERLNLPYILKEGVIAWHEGTPYSRKSPHLTAKIIGQIMSTEPDSVEANPAYVEELKSQDVITFTGTTERKKPKKNAENSPDQ